MKSEKKLATVEQLAALTGAKIIGDPKKVICGIENLADADEQQASFLENPRYEKVMRMSRAGVILIPSSIKPTEQGNFLIHSNPSFAFQKVIEFFLEPVISGFEGIHPTAVIHSEAVIEENVIVSPYAVIDRGVHIKTGTVIGPHVSIGAECVIGSSCTIHAGVVIRERCILGNRVIIQPGAVIGSCGFGYYTNKNGEHQHLKQLGNVVIEDDVEIGANTTIDRARFQVTSIGQGTKIDNLVQIGHQVKLGKRNLIVAQGGIAGSTTTGDDVTMGGQCGLNGHITIADGVTLAAGTLVSKSLMKKDVYMGIPATPAKEFLENFIQLRNVGKLADRLKKLEKLISQLLSGQEAS